MLPATPDGLENRVVVLAPAGRDGQLACRVLWGAGIEAKELSNLNELCSAIGGGPGTVLLTQEVLSPSTLGHLAAALGDQPAWSDLPVLVFSNAGARDDYP